LKKSSKKVSARYKTKIVDILLFGSFARSKSRPGDIDIAVVLKDISQKDLLLLQKDIRKLYPDDVHLNLIRIVDLLYSSMLRTLIQEGTSLLDSRRFNHKIGYESKIIFSISLADLEKSRKVLFYYALKGKGKNKGMLEESDGEEIGRAVYIIPINKSDEFREFLDNWNVEFLSKNILIG